MKEMKVYKSFTRTWCRFAKGEVTAQELESADGLQFNCMRVHLFPPQETIDSEGEYPFELTWVEGINSKHKRPRVRKDEIETSECKEDTEALTVMSSPKEVIQKFERFMEIVRVLDGKGLVTFRE